MRIAPPRKDHRPGLAICLKALQLGSTFFVWKLNRLGPHLKHLVAIVDISPASGSRTVVSHIGSVP